MSNIATLTNIRAQASYLGDGVWPVLSAVIEGLPSYIQTADSLTLYAATAVHTKVEISDVANSRPIAIIAKSNGTACYIVLWDLDADDVTVGTTSPDFGMPVSGTSGDITAAVLLGKGMETKWTTGFTIAAPATLAGSGAVASDPDVFILYHSA